MSSNELCKACTLLEGLERGMANSAIVSSSSALCPCPSARSSFPQTDRARKKLDADGPAPDNLRTIPFYQAPSVVAARPNVSVAVEVS